MNKPAAIPGIVNESIDTQLYASEMRRIDERIAAHAANKGSWPKLEWEQKMRSLDTERHLIATGHNAAIRDQSLFPVAHGE